MATDVSFVLCGLQVREVYVRCGFDADASISTLQVRRLGTGTERSGSHFTALPVTFTNQMPQHVLHPPCFCSCRYRCLCRRCCRRLRLLDADQH